MFRQGLLGINNSNWLQIEKKQVSPLIVQYGQQYKTTKKPCMERIKYLFLFHTLPVLIIKHAFSIASPAGYIVFDGLVTGQEQGDIAIDDVSVTLGACDTVSMLNSCSTFSG